jgi:hypothetical protein
MYMIAKRYKRNMKQLKTKYQERKKQVRHFSEWYQQFEQNMFSLHKSLIIILRYIYTVRNTPCPPDEQLENMSLESIVQEIINTLNEEEMENKIDSVNVQSYQMHLNEVPQLDGFDYDSEECDSVVTSVTDIVDSMHGDTTGVCVAEISPDVLMDENVKNRMHVIERLIMEAGSNPSS